MTPLNELLEMLTYCRPARSTTTAAFVHKYVLSLPGAYADTFGNVHVHVGDPIAHRVLWSSHTDTVHHDDGRQSIRYSPETGIARLSRRSKRNGRNCLGADCTAGVWLMRQMVLRGVPGRYVFHDSEERGGIGSSDLAADYGSWLSQFTFAIAFDRRGTNSIITRQAGRRTASDAFARSLAVQLSRFGLSYAADGTGLFTDTANYSDDISECTNISTGTAGEHTRTESLDCRHLARLLDAMTAIDLWALVSSRTPGDDDRPVPVYYHDRSFPVFDRVVDRPDWRSVSFGNDDRIIFTDDDDDTADLMRLYERDHGLSDVPHDSHDDRPYDDDDGRTGVDAPFDRGVYLSPEYGRVQSALRRQADRIVRFGRKIPIR